MNAEKTRLTKRDQQRIDTRNRVFRAALDEFKRAGVAHAQVETIVKNAGVSIGTYYRYFPTRDDILFELLQHYIVEIAGQLESSVAASQLSLEEKLQATVDPIFDFYEREDEILIREIFAVVVKQPVKDFDWVSVPLLAPILEGFEEAYRTGESRYPDPARPTRLFFTSFLGFLAGMNPVRHRQETNEFIKVFLKGIKP